MALVQDARVRQQIETFLTEMQLPDLRTAFFDSVPDFESLYFRDQTSTAAVASDAADQPNPDVPTETELRLFSEVHVVIYAMDAVGQMGAAWLDRLRPAMARFNHLPATGLRIVLLKYEDDNVPKIDLLHLGLDDLIFLPLDRLVFMQKMQIFLSLPKRVSPSFLFNQELKQKIENLENHQARTPERRRPGDPQSGAPAQGAGRALLPHPAWRAHPAGHQGQGVAHRTPRHPPRAVLDLL